MRRSLILYIQEATMLQLQFDVAEKSGYDGFTNSSETPNMKTLYAEKTEAELLYIIKDAGEAAIAMRGFDYEAECKYLDQVNDASTEINRRAQATMQASLKRGKRS